MSGANNSNSFTRSSSIQFGCQTFGVTISKIETRLGGFLAAPASATWLLWYTVEMSVGKFLKIVFFTAAPSLLIFIVLMLFFFGILKNSDEANFWIGIICYLLALILTPLLGWGVL